MDWGVVLQTGMRVLVANNHSMRSVNGHDCLMWSFDGNSTSSARVDFTVRTPMSY